MFQFYTGRMKDRIASQIYLHGQLEDAIPYEDGNPPDLVAVDSDEAFTQWIGTRIYVIENIELVDKGFLGGKKTATAYLWQPEGPRVHEVTEIGGGRPPRNMWKLNIKGLIVDPNDEWANKDAFEKLCKRDIAI